MNTGILLLRNDKDYSTRFFRDVALVSRINQQEQRGTDTPEGRIKVLPLHCMCGSSGDPWRHDLDPAISQMQAGKQALNC